MVIWLKSMPCRKLVPLEHKQPLDCFGHMNSSAGATEGKLGSVMEMYIEGMSP